jgi:hypothetical protein
LTRGNCDFSSCRSRSSRSLYRRSGEPHQHLLSVEGIVGYRMRAVRYHATIWEAGITAILHTDGLSAGRNLAVIRGCCRGIRL